MSRREIEIVVEDFGKARQFLEALGYRKLFYYEKYRTTYKLQTSEVLKTSEVSVHVMLDELPYGNFVEIEGETIKAIRRIADSLNLKWEAAIPTSYHMLFEQLAAKHPELDRAELSFSALRGRNISVGELSILAGDV